MILFKLQKHNNPKLRRKLTLCLFIAISLWVFVVMLVLNVIDSNSRKNSVVEIPRHKTDDAIEWKVTKDETLNKLLTIEDIKSEDTEIVNETQKENLEDKSWEPLHSPSQ